MLSGRSILAGELTVFRRLHNKLLMPFQSELLHLAVRRWYIRDKHEPQHTPPSQCDIHRPRPFARELHDETRGLGFEVGDRIGFASSGHTVGNAFACSDFGAIAR